jgi:hypothetical protein
MHRVFQLSFAALYPLYVTKVERKGRARAELDEVLCWLLGLDAAGLAHHIEAGTPLQALFAAVQPPEAVARITGVVCGVRVEAVEDPLMQQIRRMDKVVDELAKGKAVAKVIRA